MPRRRKRSERARERLENFLASKCLICYTPQDTPSKPLPCCGYRIHEDCLLSCFRYAIGNLRDCCPHCRTKITPYNVSQPAPRGSNLFCFESVNYPPPPPPPTTWDDEFSIFAFIEGSESDDLFLNPYPTPLPPPGWSQFRRQWRQDTR